MPPSSRQGGSYEPTAKSSVAQRKSEGIVAPTRIATNHAIAFFGNIDHVALMSLLARRISDRRVLKSHELGGSVAYPEAV